MSINKDDKNILSNVQDGKYGLKFDFKVNGKHYESQIRFDSQTQPRQQASCRNQYAESLMHVFKS